MTPTHPAPAYSLPRALGLGQLWLLVLFVIDLIDSALLLQRSTGRIRADEETTRTLAIGVAQYVAGVAGTYVLLGLLAGGLLALAERLWFPAAPRRAAALWLAAALATVLTLYGRFALLISFPGLEAIWPYRQRLTDLFEPHHVIGWGIGGALALLLVGAARWARAGAPLGRFALWAGGLLVYLGGVQALLHHPGPRSGRDNVGTNVVIIGIDALRPDHLGRFGYDRDTAPNLDALLDESVVFSSAWTQLPRTYPSWVTILTGALPIKHSIRDNLPEPERLVPADFAMLPQVAKAQGYATTFVTDDSRFSYMVPATGFDDIVQPRVGVQNFAVSVNEPRFRAFYGLMANPIGFSLVPTAAYNQAFGKSYRPDLFVNRAVSALADVSAHEKFFYAVHSCVLHEPGDRAYPWYRMHGQVGYRGPNRFHYGGSALSLMDTSDTGKDDSPEVVQQDIRIYDSGIDMADRLVAGLVGELKATGLWDNTIVVLLSDHGEEMWAPDLPYRFRSPNHGFHSYGDGQHNVLLAIRFPPGQQAPTTVDAPVRLMDLAPTLAEVLGWEWPNPIDGRSMMPLVRGEAEPEPRLVYIETGLSESRYWKKGHLRYPSMNVSDRFRLDAETGLVHIRSDFRPFLIAAKDRTIQLGDWKLVWHAMKGEPVVELFNRAEDPNNRHDLAAAEPRKVAELGMLLRPYLEADGIQSPIFATWEAALAAPTMEAPPAP